MDPGLRAADAAGFVQHLAQSRTIDGYTVTIRRAHADANRIAIAYTMTGPAGSPNGWQLGAGPTTLTDAAGRTYHSRGGYGNGGPSIDIAVLTFDAAPLLAGATEARLHLSLADILARHAPAESVPTSQAVATNAQGQAVAVKVASATPDTRSIAGPWSFDLTVPVAPSRTIEVNQAVTARPAVRYFNQDTPVAAPAGGQPAPAEDVRIEVQRVVIAPSETRVYLRFTPPPDLPGYAWAPVVHVGAADGSWDSRRGPAGASWIWLDGGAYVYAFDSPFSDHRGDWVLTVDELTSITQDPQHYDPSKSNQQIRLAGPWVFSFMVP